MTHKLKEFCSMMTILGPSEIQTPEVKIGDIVQIASYETIKKKNGDYLFETKWLDQYGMIVDYIEQEQHFIVLCDEKRFYVYRTLVRLHVPKE
jgi:hypothetical protein